MDSVQVRLEVLTEYVDERFDLKVVSVTTKRG
jgi:hypothetical protein